MNQCDQKEVEKQYTWDGKLSAYRRSDGDSVQFIPIDTGNADYLRLLAEIESGDVRAVMQHPTYAFPTLSQGGALTGYDTDIGFIPCDPKNPRYASLEQAMAEGVCKKLTRDIKSVDQGDYVAELLVCVLFNRAWPNVVDTYAGDLSVRPKSGTEPQPFRFTLRNLIDRDSKGAVELLLMAHNCVNHELSYHSTGIPTGVLEIAIPVAELHKLFRGEVSDDTSPIQVYLRDLLAMELCRTGRKAKDGPSIPWLIDNAHNYIGSFVSDFSNRVVEAFWNEYGGTPMEHVSRFTLQRQFLIIRRTRSDKQFLGSLISIDTQGKELSGYWCDPVGLDAVSDAPVGYQGKSQRALSRLRMLIENGFHMEAVVLVNSILEVSVSSAICQCAVGNPPLASQIQLLGHRRRLEILSELVEAHVTDSFSEEVAEYLHAAFELYKHRNDYVHDLAFPEKGAVLSHHEQRELHHMLQHFSDPWRQQAWFRWLESIARGDAEVLRLARAACGSVAVAYEMNETK